MADLLIKGMEMPTSCFYCPFREKVNPDDYVCMALNKEFEETFSLIAGKRHKDCPLVHVPPHGRLIDANELYEKTAEWEAQALDLVERHMNDEDTEEWRKWSTVLTVRSAFKFDVADAPTVIEASEVELWE